MAYPPLSNQKVIAIVLPNLRGGGAERLAIYLANDWVTRGFRVEFVLMQEEGELLSLVSSSIKITSLNVDRIKWSIFPLWRYLKQNRPDVVWAGMWPLTTASIIAWRLAGRPGNIFVTDHNQLSISCVRELGVSPIWLGAVIRVSYSLASGVMAVSKGVAKDMATLSGFPLDRIKVIYNPAARGVQSVRATEFERVQLWGTGFTYHIITVGSFKLQKNHALLIRAFAQLPQSLNAKLTILGDGDLRPEIEKLVLELNLQDRISLPGFFQDPYPWYRSSDLFVLSSDWEGLPTVLIEALECGVPVVSTDCPSGPAEILEDGCYGRLVPVGDVDGLVAAMVASLNESHDRVTLMNRAKDFSIEKISEQYLNYFFFKEKSYK